MSHATESAGLRLLDPLVGEWNLRTSINGQAVGNGRVTFAWMESGAFLMQRAAGESAPADAPLDWAAGSPESMKAIIGLDDSTGQFTMLYADARKVFRVYHMSLSNGEWNVWRAAPGFSQRFSGIFSQDGETIVGRWEWSEDGRTWQTDFDVTYSRQK